MGKNYLKDVGYWCRGWIEWRLEGIAKTLDSCHYLVYFPYGMRVRYNKTAQAYEIDNSLSVGLVLVNKSALGILHTLARVYMIDKKMSATQAYTTICKDGGAKDDIPF